VTSGHLLTVRLFTIHFCYTVNRFGRSGWGGSRGSASATADTFLSMPHERGVTIRCDLLPSVPVPPDLVIHRISLNGYPH
jgi:hypothetical protein